MHYEDCLVTYFWKSWIISAHLRGVKFSSLMLCSTSRSMIDVMILSPIFGSLNSIFGSHNLLLVMLTAYCDFISLLMMIMILLICQSVSVSHS